MRRYTVWATIRGLRISLRVSATSREEAADTFDYYLWTHGFKDDDGAHVEVGSMEVGND